VREPPRDRLPLLLPGLQARRPPARPRWTGRRQGHPGDRRHAPRASSRPPPHRRSVPSTPAASAARPSCPADPAATQTPVAAPTAATSPAHVAIAIHDPRLGQPLCSDCYDYTAAVLFAAVLFNAHAADLWRRFTTYLPRYFARLTGLTLTAIRDQVAIRYVEVAEYQARGVVHFHAIIRLDPGDTCQPPGPFFTADLLCDAIGQAATAATITLGPGSGHPATTLRFGRHTDARPVRHGPDLPGTGRALSVPAVANYIAKYPPRLSTLLASPISPCGQRSTSKTSDAPAITPR